MLKPVGASRKFESLLERQENFESGKLDFNALTKAFSSSVPITMSFVLSKDVSISKISKFLINIFEINK